MDKFPLYLGEKSTGELTVEPEALYTWFTARCRLPDQELWCAWAVGDAGELRLGILEPSGEEGVIRRRFSRQLTAPLGKLVRGEVRPAVSAAGGDWEELPHPEGEFHSPWLRRCLHGQACFLHRAGEFRLVALPWDPGKPFALTPVFCFATLRRVRGREAAVVAFDTEEKPVFFDG